MDFATPEHLAALKWELHCARSALQYQSKTARPERGTQRQEQLEAAKARVAAAEIAYKSALPEPVSLSTRSKYFIGPKRKRGVRGDGPTITCFRCSEVKPRDQFPKRGTVCCACANLQAMKWAAKNPEKRKEISRSYGLRNRDKIRAKWRKDYAENPEKYKEAGRRNHNRNRIKRNAWAREYLRRRKKDPRWRALLTCKRRMWILFKSAGVKKTLRSAELLGIGRDGLYAHLESLFLPGMTWANRGKHGWHIEHRWPCKFFKMEDPVEAKACWHYLNLRPMWCTPNWQKGSRCDRVGAQKYLDDFRAGIIRGIATPE